MLELHAANSEWSRNSCGCGADSSSLQMMAKSVALCTAAKVITSFDRELLQDIVIVGRPVTSKKE
jgi:hypothetical protein